MSEEKTKLINSEEFDNAVLEAVEHKKNIDCSFKKASRVNYSRFYQTMLDGRPDVQRAIDKPSRKKDDADKQLIADFKKDVRQRYNVVTDFMMKEELEAGKLSKIEKLAEKISCALNLLRLVGCDDLDKTFKKYGMTLEINDDLPSVMRSPAIQENLVDIFNSSVILKKQIEDENDAINETVYESKVPADLQFDSKCNQSGIKSSDFRRIVDVKTKLEQAQTEDAKKKVEDKIQTLASNLQFDISRLELVRDKLTSVE